MEFKRYCIDTLSQGIDTEPQKEEEEEKEETKEKADKESNTTPQDVVTAYHNICKTLPKVQVLTDKRKRHLNARLKQYDLETFTELFTLAAKSDFLTGTAGKWRANFDWLINENNIVKVLEGTYDNKVTPNNLRKFEDPDFTTKCPTCNARVKPTEVDIFDGAVGCINCEGRVASVNHS
jgi:hypothetical protein